MTAPRSDPASFLSLPGRLLLYWTCQVLGIPARAWNRVPWLKILVEILAVEHEADRLQEERECGRQAALTDACSHIGVAFPTHRSRCARAVSYAFSPDRADGMLQSEHVPEAGTSLPFEATAATRRVDR